MTTTANSVRTGPYPVRRLEDMVLSLPVRSLLTDVIRQQQQSKLLRAHGLEPKRRLLISGAPGNGKTLTARVLAAECGLSLWQASPEDSMFNLKLKNHLTLLEDSTSLEDCARTKSATDKMGTILRLIEEEESDNIVVATTYADFDDGEAEELREYFDAVINYCSPNKEELKELVNKRLAAFDVSDLDWEELLAAFNFGNESVEPFKSFTYAKADKVCKEVARNAVLAGAAAISNTDVIKAITTLACRFVFKSGYGR